MYRMPQYVDYYAASSAMEAVRRTVYVANIDVHMTAEQVEALFSACGTVVALRLCGDVNHPTRFAFIEFDTPDAAQIALGLNHLQIGNSSLRVARAKNPINKSAPGPQIPSARRHLSEKHAAHTAHPPVNANIPLYALPIDKQEAVSRTIYVGSVDVKITSQQLVDYFVTFCGPALKSRLAGDTYHDTRFAFIEFATVEGAHQALQLNGSQLGNFPIKVSMAKTPILNDGAVVHYYPESKDSLDAQVPDDNSASSSSGVKKRERSISGEQLGPGPLFKRSSRLPSPSDQPINLSGDSKASSSTTLESKEKSDDQEEDLQEIERLPTPTFMKENYDSTDAAQ